MPIDYSDYPADWFSYRRPAVLSRAGHKCEICGVPNKSVRNGTLIVLTTAHKCHRKDLFKDLDSYHHIDNLIALCQKCHLALDFRQHAAKRRENENKRTGQTEIEV